ncbi:putative endopeptidase [Candidatus Aquiluna sp. UB-MaderosW2red]|nr:putative endopeptidase [Candidatus Aquiluna sp. UB-MaderosW2red]
MQPGLDKAGIKPSIRAQDDLFRHVNGAWFDETEIPEDKAVYGSFHMLADDSELAVREILEEASKNPGPGVSQQIGDLYAAFLDQEKIDDQGSDPIRADLERINQVSTLTEYFVLLAQLERQGISGLWGSYIDNDAGNPERYLAHLYQGGLGLPDEDYYFNEKYQDIRDEYVPHLSRMLMLSGVDASGAISQAKAILELETKIAKFHWNRVEVRDAEKTYNLKSFEDLKSLSRNVPWDEYLKASKLEPSFLEWNVVATPSFFWGLDSILIIENLEALKSWLRLGLIRAYSPYLASEFVDERFSFYGKKLTGQPMNRPRWKRAVTLVEGGLGEAIGEIYVQKHFPPTSKDHMDKLVGHLIEAYRQSISELDWMTQETKLRALEKLEKFTPKIGYPTKFKDYSAITIDKDDLIQSIKNINSFEFDYEVKKIGSPIDKEEWHMTPQTVNAYYNPGLNEIVFPAAILQPPFFSDRADDAVNFGGIGAVIGHEIGHGFDDQGSKYDGDGKLVSWWSEKDRTAFEKLTKSLIDQYSALTPEQLDETHKVNGELTIGENIGDLGGLGIAWKAYQLSLGAKEPEVIDGYSAAQRFLMSWAQCWRGISRDEIAIQRLATDPHSPPEFRCNQVVKNLDIYYEAFGVTESDQMWLEPKKRVVIW